MGVYVHIPFCARKCYYCDFYSLVVQDEERFHSLVEEYLKAVRREALLYQSQVKADGLVSLFIGGGTPSLIPERGLAKLVRFLLTTFPFQSDVEVTIEANPQSLTKEAVVLLKEAGVNRVSLGAQAFQNSLLQKIGRTHTSEAIGASVKLLRDSGINNISLDLMFGLPNQTMEDWQETLAQAVLLKPSHLSCYSLIIEPDTPFAHWLEAGKLGLPSDDDQAEMYDYAVSFLANSGYEHYEISNFAQKGFASIHNQLYWRNEEFVGLGASATGYLNRTRYTNVASVGEYIKSLKQDVLPIARSEQASLAQEMDETMMVGMRLLLGISEDWFRRRYNVSYFEVYPEIIADLIERDLVLFEEGYLKVTEKGLLLENLVSGAFLR